jgi:type IV pilus assembly protein PilO
MTASGDFIPTEQNLDTGPNYPVVFGIPLTPTVSGILLGVFGLGAAAYLLLNLVQPEWAKYQELDAKVRDKETQVQQQQAIAAQIDTAKKDLEAAKQQRESVLTLFSSESTLNTLLLDINRQIQARNAGIEQAKQDKLATCPAWVKNNLTQVEDEVGPLVVRAQLKKFTPITDPKISGLITDGSYGPLVNGKLKREAINVVFEGNFAQTQAILRSIERLQSLLVLKNVDFVVGEGAGGSSKLAGRLFEIQGNTVRFLPNCQPETKVTSSFQLEALIPPTSEELATANPQPSPPPK